MTLLSSAVTQILIRLFYFIIIQVFKLNFACIPAGHKFPPGMNTDRQIQFPSCWCHLTAEWHRNSRAGPDAEGGDVMSCRGFAPLITQTSPLPSRGILQEKVSRLARIKTSSPCVSRPLLAQPVCCPRHTFRDSTNASTRLLIFPKRPQQRLLTRP